MIDTRAKRISVVGVGRPWHRSHDTGTINEAWRIAAGNAYSGNSVAEAVVTAGFIKVRNGKLRTPFATGQLRTPSATGKLRTPFATGKLLS